MPVAGAGGVLTMPCPIAPHPPGCALCRGTGEISRAEVEAVRALVDHLLRRYPEATVPPVRGEA